MSKVFTITEGLENLGAIRTGGQASVYKGKRLGPILSAVKLLPTPIYNESMDDSNYRRFYNEVEKLKKVNETPNPNVVKILNYGITDSGSLPFIEMEYIDGPDLEELLKTPKDPIFTVKETIKVAEQLACALAHCHGVGVKHGDVKSNNVKYNIHTGNYVLLDFGLSIMSDEQRRSSMRHAGAIEFMAPEQNEGEMLLQTDVYSCGIVLFELLTGQVPFPLRDNGETARNAVMIAHLETEVPDLLELRKQKLPASWSDEKRQREMQVPGWLVQLVYKCLAKQPGNRFHDGVELLDHISIHLVTESAAGSAVTIGALEAENERLRQQVQVFQRNEQDSKKRISFSKPVLAAIIVLLCMFGAFGLRRKPAPIVIPKPKHDTLFITKTKVVHDTFYVKPKVTPAMIDSATAARKKTRKRKKFLGIF